MLVQQTDEVKAQLTPGAGLKRELITIQLVASHQLFNFEGRDELPCFCFCFILQISPVEGANTQFFWKFQ